MKVWQDKDEFKKRVKHWAEKIDVTVNSIYVRPMKNKWASCSSKDNFNFNDELIGLSKRIGDYVIVHELLHFRVPNHGKLWKSLMTLYLGDYEKMEKELKKIAEKEI